MANVINRLPHGMPPMTCRRFPGQRESRSPCGWFLLVLLVLTVSGCRQPVEPLHEVADLLSISPPAIPWENQVPQSEPARTWDFTQGIP